MFILHVRVCLYLLASALKDLSVKPVLWLGMCVLLRCVVCCAGTLCLNITPGGSREVKKAPGPSILE